MKKEVVTIPGIHQPTTGFNHVVKAGNFLFPRKHSDNEEAEP